MEQSVQNNQHGNTNNRAVLSKCRCYFITNHNINEPIDDEKAIYSISCDDTCKDGKPHKHIVLYFKNPVGFNRIKKLMPSAHIEMAHNVEDAIHYILDNKNGRKCNIIERGNRPEKHKFKKMSDLKDVEEDDINEESI